MWSSLSAGQGTAVGFSRQQRDRPPRAGLGLNLKDTTSVLFMKWQKVRYHLVRASHETCDGAAHPSDDAEAEWLKPTAPAKSIASVFTNTANLRHRGW